MANYASYPYSSRHSGTWHQDCGLAAVYAPIGAIIGEWVGASQGLGYLMLLANGRAKIDLMFAALIVLAVLTLLLHASVDRLCSYVVRRQQA